MPAVQEEPSKHFLTRRGSVARPQNGRAHARHYYQFARRGRAWSLSEIEFGERKINNLRKCSGAQVIDSSFENSYLRQTPLPGPYRTHDHARSGRACRPGFLYSLLAITECKRQNIPARRDRDVLPSIH